MNSSDQDVGKRQRDRNDVLEGCEQDDNTHLNQPKKIKIPSNEQRNDNNTYVPNTEEVDRIRKLRRQRAYNETNNDLELNDGQSYLENDESTETLWEAPDEYPIEPFNMKNELEQGSFDEGGFYIPSQENLNDNNVTDPWLESLIDETTGIQTTKSKTKKPETIVIEEEEERFSKLETKELLFLLIEYLQPPSETPLQALKRLKQQTVETNSNLKKFYKMTPEAKKAFDSVTEISNVLLLSRGIHDALFCPRDKFLTMIQESNNKNNELEQNNIQAKGEDEEMLWQFRWVHEVKKGQATIHGPYPSTDLLSWIRQSYISDTTPVEVREVLPTGAPVDGIWRDWKSVRFEGYQDETEEQERKEDEEREFEKQFREKQKRKFGEEESDEEIDHGT